MNHSWMSAACLDSGHTCRSSGGYVHGVPRLCIVHWGLLMWSDSWDK